MRFISLLNEDFNKAKIATTIQLTLRGVPFIYYGEEIGIPNTKFKLKTSLDPIGRKLSWFPISQIKRLGFSLTRDGCRTPMQWNDEPNAGFSPDSNVKTWLKISNTHKKINVARELRDPSSLLNCYKRLLKIRKENIELQEGKFEFINLKNLKKQCLAYRRIYDNQETFIYLNFSEKSLKLACPISNPKLLFSTLANRVAINVDSPNGIMKLNSLEGIIFK